MHFSVYDTRLNFASANIIAIRGSQYIRAQLILLHTINTHNNYKPLARDRKSAIV